MIPGEHWQRLQVVFLEAFTVNELREMVRTVFDADMSNWANLATKAQAIASLFEWVENRGEWTKLLTSAKGLRQNKQDFVIICDKVLEHLQLQAGVEAESDPKQAVVLTRRLPFVDRDDVKATIEEMADSTGWCGLVVTGPTRVGKTYCREYLAFRRAGSWRTDRFAQVVLDQERDYTMAPVEVARRLALGIARTAAEPPPRLPGQKDERWAADLAVWVAGKADESGARVWIVLDGFDREGILGENHDFIEALAREAANRSNLRVILLGYTRGLPDDIERNVQRQRLDYLTPANLEQFFDHLDRRCAYRNHPACVELRAAAERFVALYGELPAGDTRRVQALCEVLPGIVRELVRLAGGHPIGA
jgi:hypothetical protein